MKTPWKLALVVAGVAVVAKVVTSKKADWQDLTEAELREKLDSRLPSQMPDEKRSAVADKVVSNMHKRGAIRQDDEATDMPSDDENADTGAAGEEAADDESPDSEAN